MSLSGPRLDAESGEASSLVIFLHGYGADGNDLIGIGSAIASHLPNSTFLAPNAPDRCTNNPMGFQWFPIPWMDGSTEEQMNAGFDASAQKLDHWLDEVSNAEAIPLERIALVGFSQGTMMSLHVGLRKARQLAGIVGFSGRLLRPETLDAEIKSRPPVLLVHGDQDEVVPPESLALARDGLAEVGITAQTHMSSGIGHGIAPDGLGMALGFLKERASL